ncbi:hypothetical protein ACFLR2_00675 [Chlamydiota bacterium]
MIRFLVCIFLLLCSLLNGGEIQLKGKLAEAHPGSYLVIEQNKTFTFFHIHDRFDNVAVIEEVSIPAASYARNRLNWKDWFESGAPGHTSWIISQVNLDSGIFEETFSYTHQGWIDMTSSNPFLTTLLNLRFQEVSLEERRRIGLPPGHHKVDNRPMWNPRLIVNGCIVSNPSFYAYKARWPSDGSELSRKTIEIYLPSQTETETTWFPAYFPYWLEVDGKIGSAKARVVDSGIDARSPKPALPKRSPQLIGDVEHIQDGIVFHLKSPIYYKEFMVFAEESETFFGNMTLLPSSTRADGEDITLFVPQEELNKLTGAQYRFTISPKEDPSLVLETRQTIKTNIQ